LKNIKSSG